MTKATGVLGLSMFHQRPVARNGAGELVTKFVKALSEKVTAGLCLNSMKSDWILNS